MVNRILILVFALFVGYICYDYGYKTAYNQQASTYIAKIKEQENKYLELQKTLTLTQLQKENEIKAINSKHDAIVSSLRNRPERTIQVESTSCSAVCAGTGSTGQQLFREDAEFLIGEATKAMILKESLTSCRRYLLETTK